MSIVIRKYKHIIAYILLFSIVTVCFPVQEFFHDHHSDQEVCEIEHHHKCEHKHHISTEKVNIGCHFFVLNKVFTTQDFHFTLFVPELQHHFVCVTKNYQKITEVYASRGPPAYIA